MVPTPGSDSKSTCPLCASAMARTMLSPRPVPWMACSEAREERKNLWKILSLLLQRDAHAVVDDPEHGDVAADAEADLD